MSAERTPQEQWIATVAANEKLRSVVRAVAEGSLPFDLVVLWEEQGPAIWQEADDASRMVELLASVGWSAIWSLVQWMQRYENRPREYDLISAALEATRRYEGGTMFRTEAEAVLQRMSGSTQPSVLAAALLLRRAVVGWRFNELQAASFVRYLQGAAAAVGAFPDLPAVLRQLGEPSSDELVLAADRIGSVRR